MYEETSNTWLQSLQSGGPQSSGWFHLLDSYGPFVRAILLRKGLEESAADDVMQNVMVIVARKLPNFERQRAGSFRTWLRGITANCLRDFLKSKQHRSRATGGTEMLDLVHEVLDERSEFTQLWNREHARHLLEELLKAVAPEFSATTILAFRRLAIDESAVDEVASELGLSSNACFVARSRVLRRLKCVQGELFGDDLLFEAT